MGFSTNNGAKNIRQQVDESLTPQPDNSVNTAVAGGTAGVEESVTDVGVQTQQLVQPAKDFSVFEGFNTDNLLSLGGTIDKVNADTINLFGNNIDLADLTKQFGVSGLFGVAPQQVDTNVQPKLDPRKNILHQYATHTYRITLGAQTVVEHQETADNNFVDQVPKIGTLLMSSGGARRVDDINRDPIFDEDFYIEDLNIATIMGSNQAAGANAVKIDFVIAEPYSVTLIERLLALANKLGYKNYIDIPFIFKIDFIGYDDDGNEIGVVPQTTRYIPFRIVNMRFELRGGQGAVYRCNAIPFNHQTLEETVSTIPESVEIAAGTVSEFFNGKTTGESNNNTTGSFVQTVNSFYNKLTKSEGVDGKKGSTSRNTPDKIIINIDPQIANSKLLVANLSKVGMLKEGAAATGRMDPTKPTFSFNAGTHIPSIIKEVIKNSTFILDQLDEAKRADEANAKLSPEEQDRRIKKKPFINFKITTRYKMIKYDEKANRFSYEATYNVTPYEVRGQQSTAMGKSDVDSIAKEYDYLFTGKNQDIIDLDIKFNLAFFNSMTANNESIAEGAPVANNREASGEDPGDNVALRNDPIMRTHIDHHPPSARDTIGTAAKEDRRKIKSDAFWKSIMQDSRADMIALDFKILGDPSFIKQDDILYKSFGGDTQNPLTRSGAIKMDQGDVFVRIKFKNLGDLDHDTGLRFENTQIPDSLFNHSSTFTGYYKIVTINNSFSEGLFTQDVRCYRSYAQEDAQLARAKAETNTNESPNDGVVSFPNLSTDDLLNTQIDDVLRNSQQVTGNLTITPETTLNQATTDVADESLTTGFNLNLDDILNLSISPTTNADRD
jgi:hypothetical protein